MGFHRLDSNQIRSTLKPGWLKRELAMAKREVKRWPEWKRRLIDDEFTLCLRNNKKRN